MEMGSIILSVKARGRRRCTRFVLNTFRVMLWGWACSSILGQGEMGFGLVRIRFGLWSTKDTR